VDVSADLAVSLSASTKKARAGSTLAYLLKVANRGRALSSVPDPRPANNTVRLTTRIR
jgi:hypothetical protein